MLSSNVADTKKRDVSETSFNNDWEKEISGNNN